MSSLVHRETVLNSSAYTSNPAGSINVETIFSGVAYNNLYLVGANVTTWLEDTGAGDDFPSKCSVILTQVNAAAQVQPWGLPAGSPNLVFDDSKIYWGNWQIFGSSINIDVRPIRFPGYVLPGAYNLIFWIQFDFLIE